MQIFILDPTETVRATLTSEAHNTKATPFFDDEFMQDLETGAETFTFSTFTQTTQAKHVVVGNFVAFKYDNDYKLFQITEVSDTHNDSFITTAYCEMAGVELINEPLRPRTFSNVNVEGFVKACLEDTSWKIGYVDSRITNVATIEFNDYGTVYSVLQANVNSKFNAEFTFRVKISKGKVVGKYVDVFYERGSFKGKRFDYNTNLIEVKRTVDTSELATALIGVGNNNITFAGNTANDKPLNQDWIGDEEAYKRWNRNGNHLMGIFKYDTNSSGELLIKTREALQVRKNPKITYELSVGIIGDVSIGDTVYVVDHEFSPPLFLSARVKQLTTSFTDAQSDQCVLSNFKEVASNISDEMREISSILNGKFPIGSDDIGSGAITSDKISQGAVGSDHIQNDTIFTDHIKANSIVTEHLTADSISADHIKSNSISTDHLKSNTITSNKIQANSITSEKIQANSIKTEHLTANSVNAESIQAESIETEHLKSNIIKANHIDSETITGQHIQAGTIDASHIQANAIGSVQIQAGAVTSDKMTIADAFIKDAMIDNITASKITAGEIDTSKVTIKSSNGNIVISDATQQFKDKNGNIRVQIGEDENGDFTFVLLDETGQGVLIDHNGLREKALGNGIIKNEMIADGEINGQKVDIDSIITKINTDGSESFLASKIQMDTTGQSLELSFSQLNQKVDNLQLNGDFESLNTKIEVIQGKIETLVDSTTIEKDGTTTTIKDAHSKLEQTVNGINSTVSSHTTTINNQGAKIEGALSSIKQNADAIEMKVDANGVISAILLDKSGAKITADKINLVGSVTANDIKSLNGLNVNNQFIVDSNGNVNFKGTLTGASGTFNGTLTQNGSNGSTVMIQNGVVYSTDNDVQTGSLSNGEMIIQNRMHTTTLTSNNLKFKTNTMEANIYGEEGSMIIESDGGMYINSSYGVQIENLESTGATLTTPTISNPKITGTISGLTLSSPSVSYGSFVSSTLNNPKLLGEMTSSSTETGVCGTGAYIDITTNYVNVSGTSVNFRAKKSYTPSSISLNQVSTVGCTIHTANITNNGFWLYIQSVGTTAQYKYWRGTYTA